MVSWFVEGNAPVVTSEGLLETLECVCDRVRSGLLVQGITKSNYT